LSPSPSQPKLLKSILKNKSDTSLGERGNLSVRRDSGDAPDKDTPDVLQSATDLLPSKGDEFVSARILLPDTG